MIYPLIILTVFCAREVTAQAGILFQQQPMGTQGAWSNGFGRQGVPMEQFGASQVRNGMGLGGPTQWVQPWATPSNLNGNNGMQWQQSWATPSNLNGNNGLQWQNSWATPANWNGNNGQQWRQQSWATPANWNNNNNRLFSGQQMVRTNFNPKVNTLQPQQLNTANSHLLNNRNDPWETYRQFQRGLNSVSNNNLNYPWNKFATQNFNTNRATSVVPLGSTG